MPRRHVFGAMAKQPAQVADLLLEGGGRSVGIVRRLKEQRVAALRADVFVAPVAVGELLVVMLAEKARQRMADSRDGQVFAQVIGPTSALPMIGVGLPEHVVVDVVAPQRARQLL